MKNRLIKGAHVWDIRSLGFSWFLHHKVFLGIGDLVIKILPYYFSFWRACWAYAKGTDAYAQHAHQFLTCMLSMRTSSSRVCSEWFVGTSITNGRLKNEKTDAYAEHTHQFLTRMLSMRTSALCVCSACASAPDAYAHHTHNGRSIRVRK
jgi:hypothetical protein